MAYPLSVVCWVLGVTHSGFHAWRGRAPSMREQERHQLSVSIRRVFEDHCGRYSAPRIYRVLCERDGYTGSLNRIQTPMRAMRLCATAGKKYKVDRFSAFVTDCAELARTGFQLRCRLGIHLARECPRKLTTLKENYDNKAL